MTHTFKKKSRAAIKRTINIKWQNNTKPRQIVIQSQSQELNGWLYCRDRPTLRNNLRKREAYIVRQTFSSDKRQHFVISRRNNTESGKKDRGRKSVRQRRVRKIIWLTLIFLCFVFKANDRPAHDVFNLSELTA